MKNKILKTLIIALAMIFSFTILPKGEVEAATLSTRDNTGYYYNSAAPGLPYAFAAHGDYVSLSWIGGVGGTAVYCVDITN